MVTDPSKATAGRLRAWAPFFAETAPTRSPAAGDDEADRFEEPAAMNGSAYRSAVTLSGNTLTLRRRESGSPLPNPATMGNTHRVESQSWQPQLVWPSCSSRRRDSSRDHWRIRRWVTPGATRGEIGKVHPSLGHVEDVAALRSEELGSRARVWASASRGSSDFTTPAAAQAQRNNPRALAVVDMLEVKPPLAT
jgi:hypothetical protein